MTITEFLTARYDEREAVARAASPGGWQYGTVDSVAGGSLYDESRMIASLHYEQPRENDGRIVRLLPDHEADANGAHIALNDPAYVLADIAAKRAIVAYFLEVQEYAWKAPEGQMMADGARISRETLRAVLSALVQPFAEHPDFDPQWSVR